MKTVKMSVKEIKGLEQFKAVSGTGKVAEFKLEGEVAVNVETGKEVKLDTLRRSWEIVVEEVAQVEAPAEEVVVEEVAEVVAEEVAQAEEQVDVEEEVQAVEVGNTVKLADGTIGKVIDIHGTLATVETADEELPVQVDALEVIEAPAQVDAPAEDKAEEKAPAKAKRQATGQKNTKQAQYEMMIADEKIQPVSSEVTQKEEKFITVKEMYELEGITLEYISGTIDWLALGDSGDEMQTHWELLRSKKQGSWHGVFFKENGEVVRDAEAGGKFMKDPSKSKSFVKAYLKESYGIDIKL